MFEGVAKNSQLGTSDCERIREKILKIGEKARATIEEEVDATAIEDRLKVEKGQQKTHTRK